MYNSFIEVVKAVREKYANAEQLSKTVQNNCYYSHYYNGIGCAIGCLFPADIADGFDKLNGVLGISALLDEEAAEPIIHQVISPAVSSAQLSTLQYWHDEAKTVEQFMFLLNNYIAAHDVATT